MGGAGRGAPISIIHNHRSALHAKSLQRLHYAVGIFLCHFHKGDVLHQVNASNLHLATFHLIVDKFYDFLGKVPVYLAETEEQARIPFLGCMVTLLLLSLCLFPFAFSLVLADLLNLRCIGIVAQETSELTTEYAFHNVVLFQPSPPSVHILHERSNLLLVNLHTLYLVDNMVELLAAYLFGFGQRLTHEFLLYHILYLLDFVLLADVNDAYRCTFLSCTSCTTAAMSVILHIVGQTVVDDMRKVIYVQSTCSHIGSHKQLYAMLTETLHRKVALLLTQFTV